jgi:hypothetical protein
MNGWPPDTRECMFLGRALKIVPAEKLWAKLISGEIAARVYCVGRIDYAPIPISPLVFLNADPDDTLQRYQIDVREDDRRRPAAIRRRIPVPHWIYVPLDSLPPAATPNKKSHFTAQSAEVFVKDVIAANAAASVTFCEQAAQSEGYIGYRPMIRAAYRKLNAARPEPLKSGRRKTPPNKSAEK